MKSRELKKLIDPTKYQVFLLTSRAPLPVAFAVHTWFVVNQKGTVSRWEIVHLKNLCKTSWDYLDENLQAPFKSATIIPAYKKYYWKNLELLGEVSGNSESLAEKMAEFILNSENTYPYIKKYSLPGPNSNTYT